MKASGEGTNGVEDRVGIEFESLHEMENVAVHKANATTIVAAALVLKLI